MAKPVGISIRNLGLRQYLNANKDDHRGLGYKEFVTLYSAAHQNLTNLSRAFNVSRPTIMKWVDIYKEELDKKK